MADEDAAVMTGGESGASAAASVSGGSASGTRGKVLNESTGEVITTNEWDVYYQQVSNLLNRLKPSGS